MSSDFVEEAATDRLLHLLLPRPRLLRLVHDVPAGHRPQGQKVQPTFFPRVGVRDGQLLVPIRTLQSPTALAEQVGHSKAF